MMKSLQGRAYLGSVLEQLTLDDALNIYSQDIDPQDPDYLGLKRELKCVVDITGERLESEKPGGVLVVPQEQILLEPSHSAIALAALAVAKCRSDDVMLAQMCHTMAAEYYASEVPASQK